GDGRADLTARGPDGLITWQSSGSDFPTELLGPSWSDADGWAHRTNFTTLRFASVQTHRTIRRTAVRRLYSTREAIKAATREKASAAVWVDVNERRRPRPPRC